jgi:hypothetical protein
MPGSLPPGHGARKLNDVRVIDEVEHSLTCCRPIYVEVANPSANLGEPVEIEAAKTNLDGSRIVVSRIGREIGGETLRERGKLLRPLRPVKEG